MFLAIAIPTLASIFWYLWQRCDEDQDDEMKNASYREQVFAWVLGVGLLLCCISMVVFVSLLLVGSSLIQSGATDSGDAIIATLPQVCLCCAYLYVCVVCVCLCVCLYACAYVSVHVCVCIVCVHGHMYVHLRMCICVSSFIIHCNTKYTHTHTYMQIHCTLTFVGCDFKKQNHQCHQPHLAYRIG